MLIGVFALLIAVCLSGCEEKKQADYALSQAAVVEIDGMPLSIAGCSDKNEIALMVLREIKKHIQYKITEGKVSTDDIVNGTNLMSLYIMKSSGITQSHAEEALNTEVVRLQRLLSYYQTGISVSDFSEDMLNQSRLFFPNAESVRRELNRIGSESKVESKLFGITGKKVYLKLKAAFLLMEYDPAIASKNSAFAIKECFSHLQQTNAGLNDDIIHKALVGADCVINTRILQMIQTGEVAIRDADLKNIVVLKVQSDCVQGP